MISSTRLIPGRLYYLYDSPMAASVICWELDRQEYATVYEMIDIPNSTPFLYLGTCTRHLSMASDGPSATLNIYLDARGKIVYFELNINSDPEKYFKEALP